MVKPPHPLSWTPNLQNHGGPLYLGIADAISADIEAGRLKIGTRLPAQRALAKSLGIDFTTVSRAYAEAGNRGLLQGRVGQGTYVKEKARIPGGAAARRSPDLSMNMPPHFGDEGLAGRMILSAASVQEEGLDLYLAYQDPAGALQDRRAGTDWLAPRFPDVSADRIVICPGAQGALTAVLSLFAQRGDTICAEEITYPGLRALASHLGIRLAPVLMDDEGITPEAFDAVCEQQKPKLLYCTPTLHNPTTATMSVERREQIGKIARRHQVHIIEDDAYGALPSSPFAPLATLAPELTFYIGGMAKSLSPALRIAYLVAPDGRAAAQAASAVRAFAGMASPVTTSIATRWIQEGIAADVLTALRVETSIRLRAAGKLIPTATVKSDCFHAWLVLPPEWTASGLVARARNEGVGLVTSDAFCLTEPPQAVRIGLGAPRSLNDLNRGLEIIADLLARPPGASSNIV